MNANIELFNYMHQPGYILVSKEPAVISTVLGSCVSVALYDKYQKIGGMNHYKLPISVNGESTAVFGGPAIYKLIQLLVEKKSRVENLMAQIFGGAFNPLYTQNNIGAENVEIAYKVLKKFNIPVISADTGGELGRKIVFNTFTGEAIIAKVEKLREEDWNVL